MHRFVTEDKISGVGEEILLGKEESAHASKVLRLRPGEPVQLIDGENRYDAVLTDVSAEGTRARVTALCPSPEATAQAVLWQGLPKADKLELDRSEGHGTGRMGNLAGGDAAQRGPAWEKRLEKAGASFPHRAGSRQAERTRSCAGGARSRLV